MADKGTGYIVEVEIEGLNGKTAEDLDFNVVFFVSETRTKTYAKEEMIRVKGRKRDRFFILMDSTELGIGQLMARTSIKDPVEKWDNGMRPVIITRYTGKAVGVNMTPETIQPCTYWRMQPTDESYEEGYRVRFRFWNELPENEYSYIYYGKITEPISSLDDITAEMIQSMEHIDSLRMDGTSLGEVQVGDTIIVAIPEDAHSKAFKDDGFRGLIGFSEDVLGTNGGHTVTVDNVTYRIFGELMIVDGEMFVYVDKC